MNQGNNEMLPGLRSDEGILKTLMDKISKASTPQEAEEYTNLYLELRRKLDSIEYEKNKLDLKLKKDKDQLKQNRFNNGVKFASGLVLCAASFFVFPYSQYLGGTLLGTGLSTLGIHVISFKTKKD